MSFWFWGDCEQTAIPSQRRFWGGWRLSIPCRAWEGGNAKGTATSQAEPGRRGLLSVYPERPCSLPVIPAKAPALRYSEEKSQLSLVGPGQIIFEDIIGSEVLEIKYIIYN